MKKPTLAEKLRELLDGMSQEEFDREWKEITKLGLEGPNFDEVIKIYKERKNKQK